MGVKAIMLAVAVLFMCVGAIIVTVVNKTPETLPPERHDGVVAVAEVRTTSKQGDYFAIQLEGDPFTYASDIRLERLPEVKSRLQAEIKPGDSIQMTTFSKRNGNWEVDGQPISILTIDEAGVRLYNVKDYEGNTGTVIRIVASVVGSIVFIVGLGIAFLAIRVVGKAT